MAKGDANDPQTQQLFQQIQQLVQSGQLGGTSNQTGQITGNAQNFMAGQRKTMGNPNPVNPYGFVPPSQRIGDNPAMGVMNQGVQIPPAMRAPMPSPSMNMPATNTGFMGNQNTGITGGMNKTYAPSANTGYVGPSLGMPTVPSGFKSFTPDPNAATTNMGLKPYTPQSPSSNPMNGQQNNPYAPKIGGAANFGATGGSFGRSY